MIPLAAAYFLPTIIAFNFRHHYAWALAILNVVLGSAVLGWLGFFVRALICLWNRHWPPGHSIRHPAWRRLQPEIRLNDVQLRSALRMEAARLASRDLRLRKSGSPVESAVSIKLHCAPSSLLKRRVGCTQPPVGSHPRVGLLTTPFDLLALLLERFGLSGRPPRPCSPRCSWNRWRVSVKRGTAISPIPWLQIGHCRVGS
ncbi:hypothetical protein ABIC09_006721 [Bradyrhizobium sp. S3.12.5]|uniref:superinfection immunity protein n=1 Tax=Bradyrhizobium sp. S3.12.5 TaxID=3156386 RepID=UPI00339ABB74